MPIISYWRWNSFNPACRSFDTLIRNIGATTALFMTWGWKNGGQHEYGGYYSIIFADYFHEQDSVAAAYEWIALDITADTLVPVGRAWARARTLDSLIDLWDMDNNHPTLKGSYLSACVFYTKLFMANPVGLTYTAGLSPAEALFLQTVAYETVYDVTEVPSRIPVARLLTVSPNPFRSSTEISIEHGTDRKMLQIYDIKGSLISSFAFGSTPSALNWDGTDKSGKRIQPGVYFIKCPDGNKTLSAKIIKLK